MSPLGEDIYVTDADKLVLVRLEAFDLDHFRRKVLCSINSNNNRKRNTIDSGSNREVSARESSLVKQSARGGGGRGLNTAADGQLPDKRYCSHECKWSAKQQSTGDRISDRLSHERMS